jgi:hypothetical protein
MNTLNRFSNLDDNDNDYYEEGDDNVNSFKPTKKSVPFKTTATVQDTTIITTPEFKLTKELFPSLTTTTTTTKSVPVPASLSFSKIISIKEEEKEEEVVPVINGGEPSNMPEGCFVAVFNKKSRRLHIKPFQKKVQTEEDIQVELFKEANQVLHGLNKLHIRRSKKYLSTWGEDEYIQTFLSERDVESAPIFLKTS